VYGGGGGGGAPAARLYGDLERWADPAQLEASLAARGAKRAAAVGGAPAPAGGWARYNAARDAAKKRAKWADVG
jgi:hypothetical protein